MSNFRPTDRQTGCLMPPSVDEWLPRTTIAAAPTKPPVVVRYRWPADRRRRPERWADAVQTLADMLDQFQEWRDNLHASLEDSPTAEALDAVLELRGHVADLQAIE